MLQGKVAQFLKMSNEVLLKGTGASPGKVTGKVKMIESKEDYNKLEKGDILVTKVTDPSMTIIINRSVGIITDIGGLTSHPAIISRELGIPCIVGTEEATTKLKDGQTVTIDGEKGEVYGKQ